LGDLRGLDERATLDPTDRTTRTEIALGATLRRAPRVLLLVTMLGAAGSLLGVSTADASVRVPAAGSGTPPVPTSSITPDANPGTVTYCVDNYAFNSTVAVVNNANGATGTIHTNSSGHGCTNMPVKTDCTQSVSNTIVATGTDQAGQPASSQATYVAPPSCPGGSPTPTSTSTASPSPSPTDDCDSNQAHLNITVTPQGGRITGTACGFLPGELIDAFAHSQPVYLGTRSAADDGTVGGTFTLPMSVEPGQHDFLYVGRTSGHQATAGFRVTKTVTGNGGGVIPGGGGPGNGVGGNTGAGGGNGLAFTGANIAVLVTAAVLLLIVGTLLVVTVRRRRTAYAA
jgi:hypothetical protein